MQESKMSMQGDLILEKVSPISKVNTNSFWEMAFSSLPFFDKSKRDILGWKIKNFPNVWRGLWRIGIAKIFHVPAFYGTLEICIVKSNGRMIDYGLVSTRVVTDTGVGFIVDAWQNLVELENMKYHALGTGSTAEDQTDTALVTELTTEYTSDVRATGTTAENAANIFESVGTNILDGTPGAALREHGLFDQAATGGGVLFDRTVFAAVTLSSGDSMVSTYRVTFTAGS
jgi:hypothetical protein